MASSLEKSLKALSKFDTDSKIANDVHLIISLSRIPPKFKLRPIILNSVLEESPKACIILKDKDSETLSFLRDSGVSPQDIYEISKLKAKFKVFEEKRLFADAYDRILVDERIFHLIPAIFGKVIFKKVKITIPFDSKSVKSGKECIKTLQKNICIKINTGSCVDVNIGKLTQSLSILESAYEDVIKRICAELGNDCIKNVHVKLPSSLALPVNIDQSLH